MPRKKSRTELLPPYNSSSRVLCLKVLFEFPDYKEKQKEGYPLRTKEELNEISVKYSSRRQGNRIGGITFEEINDEQAKKSPIIKLKKPTFRKYIQDGLLPKSIGYENIGKKRMALFPNDIINHINFLYYFYQVADADAITILKSMENIDNIGEITLLEAIESSSEQVTIDLAVGYLCGCGDPGIIHVVEEVFVNKPEEMKKIIESIKEIEKTFHKGMRKLVEYLKNNTIKCSDIGEEHRNE